MRILAMVFLIMLQTGIAHAELTAEDFKAIIALSGKKEVYRAMSNAINEQCPLRLSQNLNVITTLPLLDRIRFIQEIVGIDCKLLKENAAVLMKEYGDQGKHRMCTSSDTRAQLDADLNFEYQYYSEDGNFIFSYMIKKDDCENIEVNIQPTH